MTWSQAARDAALIARRQHATGKKVTPKKWFHGGPVKMQGNKIDSDRHWPNTGSGVAKNYAVRDVRQAMKWGKENNASVALYSVQRVGAKGTVLFSKRNLTSTSPLQIVRRLPTAKGRASRGKY